MFSARFQKQDGNYGVLVEIELYIKLKTNQKSTHLHIDNIDIRSQMERQIQNEDMKECFCRFA